MAGFFSYSILGVGLLLLSLMESLTLTLTLTPLPTSLPFLLSSLLSTLSMASSITSSLLSSDPMKYPLPLSSLPVSSFFLLTSLSHLLPLPPPFLHLLSLSAFAQQFLLFCLRNNKDPLGLENRYFDLLLVPIFICGVASCFAIARPCSPFPRLARAAGLALQGSWFLQMGFSLFSSLVAHGCGVRGGGADFSVVCEGRGEMHRGGAIATLQFNCHLAGLVAVGVGVYAVLVGRNGGGSGGGYRLVDRELRRLENVPAQRFSLDEDEDEERSRGKEREGVSVAVNGFGGAH